VLLFGVERRTKVYLKSTVHVLPYDGRTLIWDRKTDKKIIIHLNFEDFYNQLCKGISDNLLDILKNGQFIDLSNSFVTKNFSTPTYICKCKYFDIYSLNTLLENEGKIRILNTLDNYILISPVLYSKDEIDNYVIRVLSSSKFYKYYIEMMQNQRKYPQLMSETIFESSEYRKLFIDFIELAESRETMAGKIDIRTNEMSFVQYTPLPVVKEKIKEEWKWLFLM
jgi:hypothetical protein